MEVDSDNLKSYLLESGTYRIGRAHVTYKRHTYIQTCEEVWKRDDDSRGLCVHTKMKPTDASIAFDYYDRATDQERREPGDTLYLLDSLFFKEFKEKIQFEMLSFGVHCPLDDFKVFSIGKGMSITNVAHLVQNLFSRMFNVYFERIKRRLSFGVYRFDTLEPKFKNPVIPCDPIPTSVEGFFFIGASEPQPLEYADPVLVRRGDQLTSNEKLVLFFRGQQIEGFDTFDYINERTKVYAFLKLCAMYHYDENTRSMVRNETTMGGQAIYDVDYLYLVLNIYYGRDEERGKRYYFY